MDPSRENALLAMALERPAGARPAFLDRVCAGDPALRQRMEDLLAAQDEPGGVAPDGGATDAMDPLLLEDALAESPGSVVGRYKLLEKLGEGGFGVVWAAEQKEPVKRRVALKIIKLGMDTRQIVARFEAERQALAMMDHPNIARVLDAGATQTGRPYFVMELVKGMPITRYCEHEKVPTMDRLDLFGKVCHAIQHAHQKGIIHRDLKPSNIMVTLHDGVPVPKVIDFGIAKATQAELTEKTIYTQYGQFIGTPAYMSPEQAEMSGLDIDTRSDIYSLGVLLYELLTGTTPFDTTELLQSGLDGMRRIIREREPVRPSTRIRQTGSVTVSSGAESRPRLAALPADLDWIVMKCLEKDRRRRYETANALAMDLRRHLSDEPVTARPPSAAYRFQKAWKRNRVAFLAGATVILALAAGVIGTSIGLFRAAKEQAVAESNAAILEESLYFNRVALAHREIVSRPANIREAERLLDACRSELHNWEWRYLKRRRFVEPLVLEEPDGGAVQSVAFSHDGRYLASGSGRSDGDGKVRIWDLEQARLAQVLTGHTGFVVAVTFSPADPALIASAGSDDRLRLWDWRAGREVGSWPCRTGRDFGMAYSVAFSPDGQHLAAPGENGEPLVRFVRGGREALRLPGQESPTYCVTFSPDGLWIATGSAEGTVRLCERSNGRAYTLSSNVLPISGVSFTRDSQRLVSLAFDGWVQVWDVDTRSEVSSYSVRTAGSATVGLAVHPGGERVVTGGLDRLVTLSDPATGRPILVFRDLMSGCYCLGFSPDGHRLAAGCRDGRTYLWDATPLDGTEDPSLRTLGQPEGEVWALDIAPNGVSLAVGGYGTGPTAPIAVWSDGDDREVRYLPGHEIVVFSLAYDPTGRFLASSGDGLVRPGVSRVKVWDLASWKEAFAVEAFEGEGRTFSVAFSRDGKWLVGAGTDWKIKVWDAATGRKVGVLGAHTKEITALTFSSTGRYLASLGNDDSIRLWDGNNLEKPQPPLRDFPALCGGLTDLPAFSPDESRLAIVTDDDSLVIHDLDGEDRAVRLSYPSHRPLALAFSPDGRWVASGGVDCTLRIWDAGSGTLRHTFRSHTDQIVRLRYAQFPAGTRLISGSRDGTVRFWDMNAIEDR